ncbi:glycosyltransferase family 39 protein [Micrococcaceae bacterium RIT802]|nr:glycosyltransferase family 39 protein [Micrococcaceae bacterium RIT 802]
MSAPAGTRHDGGTRVPPSSPSRWTLVWQRLLATESAVLRQRLALGVLLVGTAVLYLWNLGANGWANSFYSAAIQAGSESWKAFLFGSSDAANSITVDKPPASLWIPALSVRVFGLSSWSILVPEALMGVATVWLLYSTVRRVASHAAGLLAGAVLALTPVALLMFRYNNPEALLLLLMAAAAYTVVRAVQAGERDAVEAAGGPRRFALWHRASPALRWMVLCGVLVGFGFLAKQLQVLLVVPGFVLGYLLAAPLSWRRRIGHVLGAGAGLVVAAGWWIALVELWPADSRPYIGGSQDNSFLELTFGYNGLGRISGNETGSVGAPQWGDTGITRLFSGDFASQIAWLLPAALLLVVVVAVIVVRTRALRDPRGRAYTALFVSMAAWLVVTWLVFSYMQGIIHQYYTAALAPAIAALVGIGGWLLHQFLDQAWARIVSAVLVAGTGCWSVHLLHLYPAFLPWLGPVVGVVACVAAAVLLVPPAFWTAEQTTARAPFLRRAAGAGLVLALVSTVVAPASYAAVTTTQGRSGSIITAGPSSGGPGAFGNAFGGRGGGGGQLPPGGAGTGPNGTGMGQPPAGMGLGNATGTMPGQTGAGTRPGGTGGFGGGMGGGGGGLLSAATVGDELKALLEQDASSYRWVAAAVGSNSASGYQLATQDPVMPVGGFNGSDPSPTLEQFQAYVQNGDIHYFIGGGMGMRANGGSSASTEISTWVEANFEAQTVDGVTLYDLSGASTTLGG